MKIRTPADAKRALLRMREAERLVSRAQANMAAGKDASRSERRLVRHDDEAIKLEAALLSWIDSIK